MARYVEAYCAWLDGSSAALDGWRVAPTLRVRQGSQRVPEWYNLVLPSCDGEGLRCVQQFERDGDFDVYLMFALHTRSAHAPFSASAGRAGEAPRAPRLVYAIVDRLEQVRVRARLADFADEAGEAGAFLLSTGAWMEEARAVEFAGMPTALTEADHARDMSSAMEMNSAHHDAA